METSHGDADPALRAGQRGGGDEEHRAGHEARDGGITLVALDPIPFAHKVALAAIAKDARVLKYGVPIGRAKEAIEAGRHVHVHNLRSDYVNNEVDFFEEASIEGPSKGASA
jgi:hypothetical protein